MKNKLTGTESFNYTTKIHKVRPSKNKCVDLSTELKGKLTTLKSIFDKTKRLF